MPLREALRRLPPNVQGALWLVSGGFIFTSNGAMIRLLSAEVESVQTAFFRAFFSVLILLPLCWSARAMPCGWKPGGIGMTCASRTKGPTQGET